MPLDRSRPFGEVFGDADHRYLQDGKKFDHTGAEVGEDAKAPAKSVKRSKEVPDQVGAQLQE